MDPTYKEKVGPSPHAALYIMTDNELSCLQTHQCELNRVFKNAKAALKRAKGDFETHNKLVKSLFNEKVELREMLVKLKAQRLHHKNATRRDLEKEKASGIDVDKRYPMLPNEFF